MYTLEYVASIPRNTLQSFSNSALRSPRPGILLLRRPPNLELKRLLPAINPVPKNLRISYMKKVAWLCLFYSILVAACG